MLGVYNSILTRKASCCCNKIIKLQSLHHNSILIQNKAVLVQSSTTTTVFNYLAKRNYAGRNRYSHLNDTPTEKGFGVKGTITPIKKNDPKEKRGFGDPSRVVCRLINVTKTVPGNKTLFEDVSLSFFQGAKIGILGMNGAGKSSFMKIITGLDDEYDGDVDFNKGIRVGYLAQEPTLDEEKTVRENIIDGIADTMAPLHRLEDLKEKLHNPILTPELKSKILQDIDDTEKIIKEEKLVEYEWQIDRAISALNCPPGDSSVQHLSGGERRRVALARLLIARPDILLLDEPTNHLDASSVAWLENFLSLYKGTVMAITHDRYFLDNVAGWILEIEGGKCHPFEGNYSQWLVAKQQRLEMEKRKELILAQQLKAELEWVNKNPKGRQTKSKARLERFEELRERYNKKTYEPGVILIPAGPRLGNEVITVDSLSKSIVIPGSDKKKVLFEKLSFKLSPGAIVGIVGPNGSGKTTLLKILGGLEAPDSGTVKIGQTVKIGYATQTRDSLNPSNTVYEEISQGIHEMNMGDKVVSLRKYVACFNFKSGQQDKRIQSLSGGERNRVHLAKTLKSNVNVILLDEPTNDIDIEVLRSLEEGMQDYPGCVVVVSHDRWFLDRVSTHILAFEDDASVVFLDGNYSEYVKNREMRGIRDNFVYKSLTKKGEWN